MKKNPFSLYDFLGYVFPGTIVLFFFAFCFWMAKKYGCQEISYDQIKEFFEKIQTHNWLDAIESTIALTIAAYVVGHFTAYLSSITIEKFAIWTYGYPSKFLIMDVPSSNYWAITEDFNWYHNLLIILWRIGVGVILAPITLCTFVFGKIFKMRNFFIKKLDPFLVNAIEKNRSHLIEFLDIANVDGAESSDSDFHRIIYHYEYERMKEHTVKMDNYVALYGFLRSVTFIFNVTFLWVLVYYGFGSMKHYYSNGGVFYSELAWLIIVLGLITYVFFMSFMKFYRRFTLESLMCLIVDTTYKHTEQVNMMNCAYTQSLHPSSTPTTVNPSQYSSGTE